jgi:hypothetical protein
MSLLGVLALLAGIAAGVLTRFNPTGVSTVTLPVGSVTLPLAVAVGVGAVLLAMIAFLAAAMSARTSTTLPIFAVLACAAVTLLAYKPGLLAHFSRPSTPAPAPAHTPVSPPTDSQQQSVQAPDSSQQEAPAHRARTIFDTDYPSSTPTPTRKDIAPPVVNEPAVVAPKPAPPVHVDNSAAIAAARSKMDAARSQAQASLASSPEYQSAKADADAADADLKQARLKYEGASPELIGANQAAMNAHAKLRKLVNDVMEKDPAAQQAARDLQAAQSSGK